MSLSFEVGDHVTYNPRINGLAPNVNRPRNVGIINAIDDNYATVRFPGGRTRLVLLAPLENGHEGLTHHSRSIKGLRKSHRNTYRNVLANIPMAREGMEARRVWDERVNLPFKYGPGSLFAQYYPKTVDPERTWLRQRGRFNPDGGKRSTRKRLAKKRVTRRHRR